MGTLILLRSAFAGGIALHWSVASQTSTVLGEKNMYMCMRTAMNANEKIPTVGILSERFAELPFPIFDIMKLIRDFCSAGSR